MKTLKFLLLIIVWNTTIAQSEWLEKGKHAQQELKTVADVKTRYDLTAIVFDSYIWSYPDSAAPYAQQSLLLARKLKSDSALAHAFIQKATLASLTGNYPQALQFAFEGLKTAQRTNEFRLISRTYHNLSEIYSIQNDHERAIFYAKKGKEVYEPHYRPSLNPVRSRDTLRSYMYSIAALSKAYENANQLDSALKYLQFVAQCEQALNESFAFLPFAFGNIHAKKGAYTKAIGYYRQGLDMGKADGAKKDLMEICFGMANMFNLMNQWDSSIFYARHVLKISKSTSYFIVRKDALNLLARVYKKTNNNDSAAKYFELALAAKDSLFNQDKAVQLQNLTFSEQQRQQEIEEAKRQQLYRYRLYALLTGMAVAIIIAYFLYRNNRQKQRAKAKIERAYTELKAAQAQLIQSEKMASLGELTAGIAHEIQNPLNFVNNFSDVNAELIQELMQENHAGKPNEVEAIAGEIEQNLEKIIVHGKRADAIVKSMLEHSRTSKGEKQPTDISALINEYLRLSYHGFRAKDKSFSAMIETHFDVNIGKINVVPQEIGRVLLNLFNNAFYAVAEKKKQSVEGYEPTISVSTKKTDDKIEIQVCDNGMGISKSLVEKIFQPFFTTKPTGEGTGLGLSLSYDIVKAHGGELKVDSTGGQGAAFIILLPMV
jgi:two-component system, NtrC family, sensor kinase